MNPKWSCSNIQKYKEIINKVNFDKIVTSIYFLDGHLSGDMNVNVELVEARIAEYNDFLRFSKSKSNKVFLILGEPQGFEFDPVFTLDPILTPKTMNHWCNNN